MATGQLEAFANRLFLHQTQCPSLGAARELGKAIDQDGPSDHAIVDALRTISVYRSATSDHVRIIQTLPEPRQVAPMLQMLSAAGPATLAPGQVSPLVDFAIALIGRCSVPPKATTAWLEAYTQPAEPLTAMLNVVRIRLDRASSTDPYMLHAAHLVRHSSIDLLKQPENGPVLKRAKLALQVAESSDALYDGLDAIVKLAKLQKDTETVVQVVLPSREMFSQFSTLQNSKIAGSFGARFRAVVTAPHRTTTVAPLDAIARPLSGAPATIVTAAVDAEAWSEICGDYPVVFTTRAVCANGDVKGYATIAARSVVCMVLDHDDSVEKNIAEVFGEAPSLAMAEFFDKLRALHKAKRPVSVMWDDARYRPPIVHSAFEAEFD